MPKDRSVLLLNYLEEVPCKQTVSDVPLEKHPVPSAMPPLTWKSLGQTLTQLSLWLHYRSSTLSNENTSMYNGNGICTASNVGHKYIDSTHSIQQHTHTDTVDENNLVQNDSKYMLLQLLGESRS